MYSKVLEKVISVLENILEDDSLNITEDSSIIEDLELSSLEILHLIAEFEEEYDIEFQDSVTREIIYVGDIARIISEMLEEK